MFPNLDIAIIRKAADGDLPCFKRPRERHVEIVLVRICMSSLSLDRPVQFLKVFGSSLKNFSDVTKTS